MADQTVESVMNAGAAGADRNASRPSSLLVQVSGVLLVLVTLSLAIVSPMIMSRPSSTAIDIVMVLLMAAYSIFLSAHSRSTHVTLERAYSAHLEELSQRLRNMAYRDVLTGLFNHRYFYEQLSHEVERSVRYNQPLTLLLMDMDNFKKINDTYGHMAGDKFLGMVGQAIGRQIRSSDIGARYGGDEFVVILPNTTPDEARHTAEKLEAAVAATAALTAMDVSLKLGMSVGVATCPDDSRSPGELLQIADSRLYEVKAARPNAPRTPPRGRVA
ncbi:MAG: GGDEF domain-containing protein [Dehalococcoidia bacterium]|nr:GGDEF domain-containing protein [Dehalococcoidia bacterium]